MVTTIIAAIPSGDYFSIEHLHEEAAKHHILPIIKMKQHFFSHSITRSQLNVLFLM